MTFVEMAEVLNSGVWVITGGHAAPEAYEEHFTVKSVKRSKKEIHILVLAKGREVVFNLDLNYRITYLPGHNIHVKRNYEFPIKPQRCEIWLKFTFLNPHDERRLARESEIRRRQEVAHAEFLKELGVSGRKITDVRIANDRTHATFSVEGRELRIKGHMMTLESVSTLEEAPLSSP